MALIIENGSIVADSQSYATVEELKTYARERGVTLTASLAECESLLIRAMDRIKQEYGRRFVGTRTSQNQLHDWPRINAVVDDWALNSNDIPRELIWGQCALAFEAQSADLLPATESAAKGPITEEQVGEVRVAYANTGNVNRIPASAKAEAHLNRLCVRSGLFAVQRA